MQLGRKKAGDGRRRRVAAGAATAKQTARTSSSTASLQPYTEDALYTAQPRVTDLIPKRRFAVCGVFFLGVLPILLVVAAYVARTTLLKDASRLAVAGLELYGRGTMAAWLASVYLTVGAVLSWMIYSIRRHRTDDFRGSYGFWRWATAFFLIMSIDAVSGLHYLVQAGFDSLFHEWAVKYGARCWTSVLAVVVGLSLIHI